MGSRAWGILPAWGWGTAQEAAELAALDDLPSSSRQPCPSAQVTASTGSVPVSGVGTLSRRKPGLASLCCSGALGNLTSLQSFRKTVLGKMAKQRRGNGML